MTAGYGLPRPRRYCIYRHFDASGVLLYVGISADPQRRAHEHAETKSRWIPFAVSITGRWYDNQDEAEHAELVAIRDEDPIFNTFGRTRDAQLEARKQEYERMHTPAPPPVAKVDPRRTREQVAQLIRDAITSGELKPGERTKTILGLAAEWRIGQDSMIRVVQTLIEEGWFVRHVYRGPSFVTRTVPPVPLAPARAKRLFSGDGIDHTRLVKRHVRGLIDSGKFGPRDRLPALSALAKDLSVNIRTAQRAMEQLRAEGLVTARKGDGTFVADEARRADGAA